MKENQTEKPMRNRAVHLTGAFSTFPLMDEDRVEAQSQVAIPSESEVEEARQWVDFKEM